MARRIREWDITPVLEAGKRWIDTCLVGDGSVFSLERLWTAGNVAELRRAFVDRPDTSDATYLEKLEQQMRDASPASQKLMAEMNWALLLFPSNIKATTKRALVEALWRLTGDAVPPGSVAWSDEVLRGIGSGGQGFNNFRPRELAQLIEMATSLKAMTIEARRSVFESLDGLWAWLDSVPQEGYRQFRHMLRYFAFPDRIERICSNRDKKSILMGYGAFDRDGAERLTDQQIDEALLALRTKLETDHPGEIVDFYDPAFVKDWKIRDVEPPEPPDDGRALEEPAPEEALDPGRPVNRIYYGPPGTGKTYRFQQLFEKYTDRPEAVDETSWLQDAVKDFGWRAVIAATLADLARAAKVTEIREHRWFQAKANQMGRNQAKISATIWSYLQEHTPETVSTVRVARRREPFVFTKAESGNWSLLPAWRDLDEEAAALERLLRAGRSSVAKTIERFRLVTFHPSFSYEDFVQGIRPVSTGEESQTVFQRVDGVLKQICNAARANPAKRFALFIDEINRANVAKVFGELISLIEIDKRGVFDADGRLVSGLAVQLPGAADGDDAEPRFSVPANLDIYGTMNTADRSIALLDVALRRRFDFEEMQPDYGVLPRDVEGVDLAKLLRRINDRLEFVLDRDHRIGHAYLIRVASIADLCQTFAKQVIPLLQEYFFEDLGRVEHVLRTSERAPALVGREPLFAEGLFNGDPPERLTADRVRFVTTDPSTWTAATFQGIYEDSGVVETGKP